MSDAAGGGRRIAFFDPYPHAFGGAQRTTLMLASALREAGWDASLLTTGPGPLPDAAGQAGVPLATVTLPAPLRVFGHQSTRGTHAARAGLAMPVAWARVGSHLRRTRTAILHAVDLRGILLAGPAARMAGATPIWHAHLTEPNARLNRAAQRLAAAVVVPTRAALGELPGVVAERVQAIPNAVDPAVLDLPVLDGCRAGPPVLVTCARLTPQKGLDVLIQALGQLRHEYPDLTATVYGAEQVGYEDHAASLRAEAATTGLDGVVRFAGHLASPVGRFPSGAIYVQPSRYELLPLSIIEAMAVGLPVVATAVGGVPELVDHGVTGLLVAPDDRAGLTAAVRDLVADPQRAAAMGRAGAAAVRRSFSVAAMAARWDELYRRVAT